MTLPGSGPQEPATGAGGARPAFGGGSPAFPPAAPRGAGSLLNRVGGGRPGLPTAPAAPGATPAPAEHASGAGAAHAHVRQIVQTRLVDELRDALATPDIETLKRRIAEILDDVVRERSLTITRLDRVRIMDVVAQDMVGLGPLDDLLADETVTEIMVNGPKRIYVERGGHMHKTVTTFESDRQLLQVIDRIVQRIGRRIDESSPMVDARLQDGSRVHIVIPPLALTGATVTIRKFGKEALTAEDLLAFGTCTPEMLAFMRACVRGRLNIAVAGGGTSGKTTTLNILSGYIPDDERIVTIEDAAELQLHQTHVVPLETRPPNVEGKGRITIRDLVINSLRMRPDRIVIGECRGGEALDMLQAMNTGHDGSLTTLHANTAKEVVSRLETMVLMAGTVLPSRAIREQIGSAINIIIQQARLRDGTRKVTGITEVTGTTGDTVMMQDIFRYTQTGVDEDGHVIGHHSTTGVVPHFLEHLEAYGEGLPREMFAERKL